MLVNLLLTILDVSKAICCHHGWQANDLLSSFATYYNGGLCVLYVDDGELMKISCWSGIALL